MKLRFYMGRKRLKNYLSKDLMQMIVISITMSTRETTGGCSKKDLWSEYRITISESKISNSTYYIFMFLTSKFCTYDFEGTSFG